MSKSLEIHVPKIGKTAGVFSIISTLLFLVIVLSITLGSVYIPLDRLITIIFHGSGTASERMIILSSRLPRVLGAAIGGAVISCAGLLLQIYFRNPIVDSYVLGVISGAQLFVGMGILLGVYILPSAVVYPVLIVSALVGAMLATFIVITLAHIVKSKVALLLMGLMLGYIFNAAVNIMVSLAETTRVHAFALWALGSFANVTWPQLYIMVSAGFPLILFTWLISKPLNAIILGEEYAQSVGVNIKRIRMIIVTLSALMAAVIVTFCGPISFIGMAVPHLARLILKSSNNRLLIPATSILGAIITVFCDLVARILLSPVELPLSAVTSFFGAPIVIFFLLKMRRGAYD